MRKVTPVDMSGKTACFRRDVIITAMDETGIPRLQPWECQEVLADPFIASLSPGSNICVLQFPESRSLVNTEYALPFDFLQRDISIPIS